MSILSRWKAKLAARKRKLVREQKDVTTARDAVKRAEKVVKRHAVTPADRAVTWAMSHKGVTESPPNSNRGKLIDEWQHDVDMLAQPWCGAFVHAALKHAGVKSLSSRMRYTPFIVTDAKQGVNGLEKVVAWGDRRKGDLLLFNWDGGVVDHVGLYTGATLADGSIQTVEGNTSSSNAGSQSNGGGVFVRTRPRSVVQYVVRPRWQS